MKDPDSIIDLCEVNIGHSNKFEIFWENMRVYLNDASSVHERRHGKTTHIEKAISVRNLIAEVAKMCPDEPVPSEQWVGLQFCPKNPHVTLAYRSKFHTKVMVQKHQFKHSHVNDYYCAALFCCMKEFASRFRDLAVFISITDKHRIKVGEPSYSVAAAERG